MLKETTAVGSWIVTPRLNPRARLRLFCFPYSGGGASIFWTWPQRLPEAVEVCAVQLPGRETRFREVPVTDVLETVGTLADVLRPCLTLPYAFFGHSLGAFVSFELIRQLRRQNALLPVHFFVSGQHAPQLPNPNPPIHRLPGNEFISELCHRYNGIPQEVLQCHELMQILLPVLRADLRMAETYVYIDDNKPLDCPITCLGGQKDPQTTNETLAAWGKQTRSNFKVRMFPGDHFFIQSERISVLQALSEELKGYTHASV